MVSWVSSCSRKLYMCDGMRQPALVRIGQSKKKAALAASFSCSEEGVDQQPEPPPLSSRVF